MLKTIGIWALTALLVLFFLNVSYRKFSGNAITAHGHFPRMIKVMAGGC